MFSTKCFMLFFLLGILGYSHADNVRERLFKNGPCARHEFRCLNNECIKRSLFCNGEYNCNDGSDEQYCNFPFHKYIRWPNPCPRNYPFFPCSNNSNDKCIPKKWQCDGIIDCRSGLDEEDCNNENPLNETLDSVELQKLDAIKFLKEISKQKGTNRWGEQVHRIAVAFYLADTNLSRDLNLELANEVEIQLLSKITKTKIEAISSSEIALFIHALLVTCKNPKDFNSLNLISELRKRVNAQKYTNPYVMLAMCNAGDAMEKKDIEKLIEAFDNNQTEFWTDTQAYAVMALTCAANQLEPHYSASDLRDLTTILIKNQKENGIVDNLKTTSLVLQALFAAEENETLLDEEKAIKQILAHQLKDGSFENFINTYYALPVLNYRSLASIRSDHCLKSDNEEEQKILYKNWFHGIGTKYSVQYSQWIGDQKEFQKSYKLRVPTNTSLYTLMKMAASVDDKSKFKTNIKDGKPFVYSMADIQDDPESGKFWFLYFLNRSGLVPVKSSPVDLVIENNQHFVYWFRTGSWH